MNLKGMCCGYVILRAAPPTTTTRTLERRELVTAQIMSHKDVWAVSIGDI